ncbi:GntR family transcriptional regulator [Mesorhizobium sp. CAU 1732]|uniref:GntR family transcriptional regulator n=1 Tax=Mesorhizobium sp. CAU 1732 TaxID=3140358 RepID=UPI00326092D1
MRRIRRSTQLEDLWIVLADSVYGRLRLSMMRAELVPHQRLKVRDLAKQMGTSETPVREALLQLAREGAVEVRPRFFIRVPRLTLADYKDIRDIRLELEPMAAERAMSRLAPADIERLHAVHLRLIDAERRRDWRTALEANRDFHFGMFDRAGMPALVHVLEGLWTRVGPMLSQLYPAAPPTYGDGHQHLAILDALRRRDPYGLRMAIRLDLIEGGRGLLRRIAEQEAQDATDALSAPMSHGALSIN